MTPYKRPLRKRRQTFPKSKPRHVAFNVALDRRASPLRAESVANGYREGPAKENSAPSTRQPIQCIFLLYFLLIEFFTNGFSGKYLNVFISRNTKMPWMGWQRSRTAVRGHQERATALT